MSDNSLQGTGARASASRLRCSDLHVLAVLTVHPSRRLRPIPVPITRHEGAPPDAAAGTTAVPKVPKYETGTAHHNGDSTEKSSHS